MVVSVLSLEGGFPHGQLAFTPLAHHEMGSCAEIRWAQQCAEGSGDLWLVVSPGWLREREDGARELALVPSDSLGFHFTYLKIKILGFWVFKTHLAAHGDF